MEKDDEIINDLIKANFPGVIPEKRPVDDIWPEAGRQEAIANKRCINPPFGCGKSAEKFRDKLSEREYQISGLCQDCQNKVFGPGSGS